jgi:hypothetical protein
LDREAVRHRNASFRPIGDVLDPVSSSDVDQQGRTAGRLAYNASTRVLLTLQRIQVGPGSASSVDAGQADENGEVVASPSLILGVKAATMYNRLTKLFPSTDSCSVCVK